MYHFCVDDTAQFIESAYRIDAKLNRVGTPMDAFPQLRPLLPGGLHHRHKDVL